MRTFTPADAWHTSFDLPEDAVDQRSASSISTPCEALGDMVTHVHNRLGVRYLVNEAHRSYTGTSVVGTATGATFGSGTQDLSLNTGLVVQAGDTIECHAQATFYGNGIDTADWVLAYKVGVSGTVTQFAGAGFHHEGGAAAAHLHGLTLVGWGTVASGGALYIVVQGKVGSTGAAEVRGPYSILTRQTRDA